jgi:general secretion pathway protein K
MSTDRIRKSRKGGALLAVLWLTAALAAIVFSVATTIRAETERTTTLTDGVRARFLATSAVERGITYMLWGPGPRNPDGSPRYYEPGMPRFDFIFPSGIAQVEIIPEFAKLNVNSVPPPELLRLLLNLGVPPGQADQIAGAIVDWRTPAVNGSPFDAFYSTRSPSFRARHASLEELEELLFVTGMTPELFHGTWARDPQGRLVPRGGLKDCLSVYGSQSAVDANYAHPAVLLTVGLSPDQVNAIVERRRALPFRTPVQLQEFLQGSPGLGRLQIGGGTMFTLRATARLRAPNGGLTETRRTVSALVKLREYGYTPPLEVLRWYEN